MEGRVHFDREEHFRLRVAALFARERAQLLSLLPDADVQHVGGTSVPGCLTKGDLDVQVRVPPALFEPAEAVLASRYGRNFGNERTRDFASFERYAPGEVPLGVQLTAIGGPVDDFWRTRDLLRARPDLRHALDVLKASFEGQPMSVYRAAKERFFRRLPRGT